MRRRNITRNWILAPLAIVLASSAIVGSASGADSLAGSQGTDTSLPVTDSQDFASGRGVFENLKITVNQTRNLTNQAVSITWEGGEPTIQGPGRFAGNFLQIFQCWGDDDGSVPGNPGPPPEQCVQGAATGVYSGGPANSLPAGLVTTRVISVSDWNNFDPNVGKLDARTQQVWRPFKAVDGTVINEHADPTFNPNLPNANYWLNPYFNIITTNEAYAVTGNDGRGAELFQVLTGVQSSGLGCGQRVQKVGDQRRVPKCWVVVVPRSTPAVENAGTPFDDRPESYGVYTSALAPAAWANRIAIPMEFNAVDSPCALGANERRIAGNELAGPAIASWQPALCTGGSLPPFSYIPVGDGTARGIIANPAPGAPGMAVVQRPIDPALTRPSNPIVYAPLTASGLTIAFNVERSPRFDADASAQELAGVRVADINLTPRLVAKLLTQSYRRQLEIYKPPDYGWLERNPVHLGVDPDFRQFNPEFATLEIFEARTFSGLQLPQGNSDAAEQVWKWVLSDPEAAAWLAGSPDPFGMRVNPAYITTAAGNTSGNPFGSPPPNSFPKAEPYCYQSEPLAATTPPPLCGTDWMPYARNFEDAAIRGRRAFDGSRISLNPFAQTPATAWGRSSPQQIGARAMISLTDTPSASLYGLQSARLSRAGDNSPSRKFIAPNSNSLTAGLAAMIPSNVAGVLEPGLAVGNENAYPLTSLTYAAIAPLGLDSKARTEYAAFLDYAAGAGQESGSRLGQLPTGFVPLSADLEAQTVAAAQTVRDLQPATPAPPPPPATVPAPNLPSAPPLSPDSPTPAAETAVNPTQTQTRPRSVTSANSPTSTSTTAITTVPVPDASAVPAEEAAAVVESVEQVEVNQERAAVATPPQDVGSVGRVAVPVLGATALASALFALELTKRPRRSLASKTPPQEGP